MLGRGKKNGNQKVEKVTVYVRNYAKKAIMLTIDKNAKMEEIRQRVYHKMKVPQEDQVLILNGQLIPNDEENIYLENKLIFHLVNLKRVRQEKITITIRKIEPNSEIFRLSVPTTMLISQFIKNVLSKYYTEANHYFLIYTGRELKAKNTFRDEFVEDDSEILCVHKIKNLKSPEAELVKKNRNGFEHNKRMETKKSQNQNQKVNMSEEIIEKPQKNNQQNVIEDIYIPKKQQYSIIKKDQLKDKKQYHKKVKRIVETDSLNPQCQLRDEELISEGENSNKIRYFNQPLRETEKINHHQQNQIAKNPTTSKESDQEFLLSLYDVLSGNYEKFLQKHTNESSGKYLLRKSKHKNSNLSSIKEQDEIYHSIQESFSDPCFGESLKKLKSHNSADFIEIMLARTKSVNQQNFQSNKRAQIRSKSQLSQQFVQIMMQRIHSVENVQKNLKTQKSKEFVEIMKQRIQKMERISKVQKTQKSKEFVQIMKQRIQTSEKSERVQKTQKSREFIEIMKQRVLAFNSFNDTELKTLRRTENSKEFIEIMNQRLISTPILLDEIFIQEKLQKLTNKVDLLESYEVVQSIEIPIITVINEEQEVGPKLGTNNAFN